ncbi:hypothetical protein ACTXT7_015552 [Hymenolepis weldensis]
MVHFLNKSIASKGFAISTVSQRRPPIVVASVIPLSRDPLMLSGIPKGQNGTPATISSGGGNSRQRFAPEIPTALLSTLFRHNTSGNVIANSINYCPRSGSIGQEENLPIVKPLKYSKPVDSVERSYAHFLVPRRSLQHSLNLATPSATNRRQSGRRRRAETVAGDEVPESEKSPSRSPSTAAESNGGQYRSRSHTLSFSSMASAISRPDKGSSLRETGVWGIHSVDSTAYPSSSENIEPSQAVVYDDPLIKYDPLLLDDPLVPRVTNRRVFPFQGYITSILGYRRADEHKKSINREFHQRFPNIQLTLTKMRSIKLNILAIALRMNLDLWIVAHAYVLFEKMILKLFVCKANRKLCAGSALLISAKLNDLKGPIMPAFIQRFIEDAHVEFNVNGPICGVLSVPLFGIENVFRISHRDLIHMEMAAFIGLEFCVLPNPTEALPHFTQIQKSLGVVVAAPRYPSVPTRSHSLVDENFHSHPSPHSTAIYENFRLTRLWAQLKMRFTNPYSLEMWLKDYYVWGEKIAYESYQTYYISYLAKVSELFSKSGTIITNEMKRHVVIVSIKAKNRNLEIARFLKVSTSYICKVREELDENHEGELAVMRRRKQEHCQRSADLLRTPEFMRRAHVMIDENPGKSMCDILPKIFKCLKEE